MTSSTESVLFGLFWLRAKQIGLPITKQQLSELVFVQTVFTPMVAFKTLVRVHRMDVNIGMLGRGGFLDRRHRDKDEESRDEI